MGLVQYLPPGDYLNTEDPSSEVSQILAGYDSQSTDLKNYIVGIIEELDPRTTTDFLEEWASLLDVTLSGTVADQRIQIVDALTTDSVKTKQFFIDLATANGDSLSFLDYYDMSIGLESGCIEAGLEDGCGIHAFDGRDFASFTIKFLFTISAFSDLNYSQSGLESGSLEAGSEAVVFGLTDSEREIMDYFPREMSPVFSYTDTTTQGVLI